MSEICNNFITKTNINENNINYIYDCKDCKQFDKVITFNQMANIFYKARKKMNILVVNNNIKDNENNNTMVKAKNIICPKCGEQIKINKIENNKLEFM